jgi:hypothetical protein
LNCTEGAVQLINFTGNIDEYFSSALEVPSQNWEKRFFSPLHLKFLKKEIIQSHTCLLEEYTAHYSHKKLYRLVLGDIGYKVTVDWGRYLILKELGRQVLLYDWEKRLLAIPKFVPLPRLLARATILCSGSTAVQFITQQNIASIPVGCLMDQYEEVPIYVAKTIAEKLGQKLQPYYFTN